MEIIDKTKVSPVKFKELNLGDVFERSGDLYLKIDTPYVDSTAEPYYNAVCLSTYTALRVDDYTNVIPVKSRLEIY